MKVQILRQGEAPVQGYNPIFVEINRINLDGLAQNQCEMILASDIFDCVTYNNIEPVLQALLSKLRLGGQLVVGGTDYNLLGSALNNKLLSEQDAARLIGNISCVVDGHKIADGLRSLNLAVETMHMDGIHFEVKARRKQ